MYSLANGNELYDNKKWWPGYNNTIKIKVDKMVSAFYNGQVKKSVSIQFESESEIN